MAEVASADMLMVYYILIAITLWGLARRMLPLVTAFAEGHGLLRLNYKGEAIPTACGMLLWLLQAVFTPLHLIAAKALGEDGPSASAFPDGAMFMSYISAVGAVAFVGFVDDAVGNREIKGIAGHWKQWKRHKQLGTGLLKAGGTAVGAVIFIFQIHTGSLRPTDAGLLWQIGGQVLLIMLMTNGINLLDLRPGRAIKGFFLVVVCLLADMLLKMLGSPGAGNEAWLRFLPFCLPILAGVAVMFIPDLRGRLMLGDTGANLIGFAAGCWTVMLAEPVMQLAALAVLLLFHAVTWRASLSRIIERNRLLLWLDLWGRS